ncbi:MAG: DUF1273 family protein [Oscillospiraceae bacterium]|nr:DUF1273 family protein [Oscillospiraceae bacterium]
MNDIQTTCCFTGHRSGRLPWLSNPNDWRTQALADTLWQQILTSYEEGYRTFYSGMARGVDLLCARLVLQLQEEDPAVQLIPAIPFPGQARNWPQRDREEYQSVLDRCGENAVIVSPSYTKFCFFQRNRYMVDHSSKVIGVFDGTPKGGTYQTLEYARKKGLKMELILPE